MIERLLELRKDFYEKNEILFSLESEWCFRGLKSNEVHCICYVKDSLKPNITNLAGLMKVGTSGMTKITTKLVKKGYLMKYKQKENKKEVYFSLTDMGEEIYSAHEKAHDEGYKKNYEFLSRFSQEEVKVVIDFFEKNNEFLDEEIKNKSKI